MRLSLIFALVLFTGCVPREAIRTFEASRATVLAEAPPPLETLNATFGRGTFTLVFDDATEARGASQIALGADTTVYRVGAQVLRVPTDRVQRIERHRRGAGDKGALLGATPGLLLTGIGIATVATHEDSGDPWDGLSYGLALVATGLGILLATGGAMLGAASGETAQPERRVVLYQAPLDRYLAPADSTQH